MIIVYRCIAMSIKIWPFMQYKLHYREVEFMPKKLVAVSGLKTEGRHAVNRGKSSSLF